MTRDWTPNPAPGARRPPSPVATEDSQTLPPPPGELVTDVAGSASALTLQKSITASSQSMLHSTSDPTPPASSIGSKILIRRRQNWYQVFYIRMNQEGSFCMYPNLGGPFRSIDEAEDAIDHYLDELRHRAMCKGQVKLSGVDRLINGCRYYLDGTPKRGPNSPRGTGTVDEKWFLVQALLHQYNEDHNLSGNRAHELECLVGQQWIYEDHRWYYHFNFTTKKNEGDDSSSTSNLFFAEVSHMQGEMAWEVNGCCMVNGENGHCYGCRNNGSPDMKHPNNSIKYTGGHLDGYLPFGREEARSDDETEEEERLRARFKGLDDPHVFDRTKRLTPRRCPKQSVVGLGSLGRA